MDEAVLSLDAAVDLTRTGDLWLFRGRSAADHAIRAVTNAPVNHVGMAVVLDDLPPLMWHAELSKGLLDVWTGTHHRGVQLHDLRAAVEQWSNRYDQRSWLRQLHTPVTPEMEDAVLRTIARMNGTPFPATATLAGRWLRGRLRQPAPLESTYCAEVVAGTYQAMGLLDGTRPTNYYDPGMFWSGDDLELLHGAQLGEEIRIRVPRLAEPATPASTGRHRRIDWLSRLSPGTRPRGTQGSVGEATWDLGLCRVTGRAGCT